MTWKNFTKKAPTMSDPEMKPNYKDMTKAELRLVSAERFGEIIICEASHIKFVRFGIVDFDLELNENLELEWDPTDPNSNQVERYIFPKLMAKNKNNIEIETLLMGPWFCIEIRQRHNIPGRVMLGDHTDMLATLETKDLDQEIEKTKLITALLASDEMEVK